MSASADREIAACAQTFEHYVTVSPHVQPYSAGGPTVEDNGRVACGYHNRLRHRRR